MNKTIISNLLYFLCCFLSINFCIASTSNTGGIQFFKGSWTEAVHLAQEQNKLVFVEAYTDWCGPCRHMDKHTFTRYDLGNEYNNNFINVKINIESLEGIAFKMQYNIMAIPDFLFFNTDGELIYRDYGQKSTSELLSMSYQVIAAANNESMAVLPKPNFLNQKEVASIDIPTNKNKNEVELQSLSAMQLKYEIGSKDANFLYDYAHRLKENDLPSEEVVDQYLKIQHNKNMLSLPKNLQFVYDFASEVNSLAMNIFIENQTKYERRYGVKHVDNRIKALLFAAVEEATQTKNEKLFERSLVLVKKANLSLQGDFVYSMEILYYEGIGDSKNYVKSTRNYMQHNTSNDPIFLNRKAWELVRLSNKKSDLKIAKKWVEKSINLESHYYNNETYARILYKLGEKDASKAVLYEAIAIAKRLGIDFADAQDLLDKIDGNLRYTSQQTQI
ncbi:MAG: thioredoxin family protein [Chitinophagales bacterium]